MPIDCHKVRKLHLYENCEETLISVFLSLGQGYVLTDASTSSRTGFGSSVGSASDCSMGR